MRRLRKRKGRFSGRRLLAWTVAALVLAAGLVWAGLQGAGLVTRESHRGFYAPAISPDGSAVWFFERQAAGLAVGPGWEHFTPPARVRISSDVLALRRVGLNGERVETLLRWERSPLVGRPLHFYRGRVLGILAARIRLGGEVVGEGAFDARISIPRVPTSETWSLSGVWPPQGDPPGWQEGSVSLSGLSRPVVAGDLEVLTLPGEESFPAAVVLLDHGRRQAKVLVANASFAELYPEGLRFEALLERSRKAEVDRLAEMERTYDRLVAKFMAEGMLEGAARLAAGDEMARLGWWSTPASLVATPVENFPAGLEVFVVDPMEIRVGLFPDLEKAIGSPGEPVERFGPYLRHDGYDTSERLNAFLATDPEAFGLRIDGRRWRIDLIPRKPASR